MHASLDRGLEITVGLIDSLIMLTGDQDPEWVYWIDGEFKYGTYKKDTLELSLFMVMVDISSILRRKFLKNWKVVFSPQLLYKFTIRSTITQDALVLMKWEMQRKKNF